MKAISYYKSLTLAFMLLAPLAVGQSVLKTYYADDLTRVPGVIEVSPGFTTVMDFWDTVSTLASAKGELLRVESAGPRILISATQKAGQTDLVVEVAGRTLLFTLKIGPGVGPRRYVIELSRARSGVSAPTYIPPVSTPAPSPQPQVSNPQTSTPAPQAVNPDGVRFTTTAQVPSDGKGTITLFFTLENRGARTLAADPGRLVITQGGNRLSYSLKREPLKTLINPGEALSGLITLEGARAGEISLEWGLVEIGSGRQFALKRSVMAGTRIELEGR
ncbi:hypothetical protein EWH23_03100 [Meiothermus sp. PNK-Is4]|uniref:Uncharacterized protein n=1 Tax=Allomeiothermus silvanus (strain ATCC 700542 / DSM 9946 / NBRC 106475 / NCIMB 13440 / VI-R2) TaxID=526227 RepID=D7B9Z5_ALLS1|nr:MULTISPECIES: hypothetical protein [Thermaceae]ADH62429.1 hypothetical protein Mesil_0496 [Allomeiothermus silvanus DSM 9946]RYM39491.1 hypothetical protein EWH23_03100 [Meiothermus sp. PNK-Is4]